MNIRIVRHADSESGHAGVMSGVASCRGLTVDGHRQARHAARALALAPHPDVVVSSPVRRARETCDHIANWLALPVSEDCSVCELHLGEADGLTPTEHAVRFGQFDLLDQPDRPIAPGGESWNEFRARVRATMDGYAQQYPDQTVLVVSHAGFIVMSVLALFDIPRPGTRAILDPQHCAVTSWRHDGAHWHLDSYNLPSGPYDVGDRHR